MPGVGLIAVQAHERLVNGINLSAGYVGPTINGRYQTLVYALPDPEPAQWERPIDGPVTVVLRFRGAGTLWIASVGLRFRYARVRPAFWLPFWRASSTGHGSFDSAEVHVPLEATQADIDASHTYVPEPSWLDLDDDAVGAASGPEADSPHEEQRPRS